MDALYLHINAVSSDTARNWYMGLQAEILSLRELPNRSPVAPENKRLRHLLYGRKPHIYRVMFRVLKKARVVEVLHIRHGARRRFRASDLG